MRVKLGKRIYFCTLATKSEFTILLTTSNGVYVVDCKTSEIAEFCHNQLLKNGWYDFSDYDYEN